MSDFERVCGAEGVEKECQRTDAYGVEEEEGESNG